MEKMFDIYEKNGNYHGFTWENEEVWTTLCFPGLPKVVSSDDAQTACVYLALPKIRIIPEKQQWYCADSIGNIGYTSVDPSTDGYCVSGEKTVCPTVKIDPPFKALKDLFLFFN